MGFLFSIKNNKRKFFAILTVVLLVLIAIILFAINPFSNSSTNLIPGTTSVNLKNLDSLRNEAKGLRNNPEIANSSFYPKIVSGISALSGKGSSEDKYKITTKLWEDSLSLYFDTNDSSLYKFQQGLNDFIKLNFPNKNNPNLRPLCFDEACAENPIPPQIQKAIEEIEDSTIPDPIKLQDTQALRTYSYINNNWVELKVNNYLEIALYIKANNEYEKAKINEKVSEEIINYIKTTYPKEYESSDIPNVQDLPSPTIIKN